MNPFQSTHLMGVIKMRRVMKKLVAGLLSLIIIFSVIIPTPLAADNTNVNSPQSIDHNSFISEIEQQEMIKKVQPYVAVTDDGKIFLKDAIPSNLYDKYDLDE